MERWRLIDINQSSGLPVELDDLHTQLGLTCDYRAWCLQRQVGSGQDRISAIFEMRLVDACVPNCLRVFFLDQSHAVRRSRGKYFSRPSFVEAAARRSRHRSDDFSAVRTPVRIPQGEMEHANRIRTGITDSRTFKTRTDCRRCVLAALAFGVAAPIILLVWEAANPTATSRRGEAGTFVSATSSQGGFTAPALTTVETTLGSFTVIRNVFSTARARPHRRADE